MIKSFIVMVLAAATQIAVAQDRPFRKEIQEFKRQDSIQFPPKNAIVFTGSSSFTKWTDVQQYFPEHVIINRGFGGSGLPHLIAYANDIIIPYQPKQVVIYCGENDFYHGESVTPTMVADRFVQLFKLIRQKLPKVYITFVSLKPSPRRQKKMPEWVETNTLISDFIKTQKRASFVDVYHAMLDAEGNPRKELFEKDSLHMNSDGYVIWQRKMEPYLKKTRK
jgi:lysophospholipase L1-like esterase